MAENLKEVFYIGFFKGIVENAACFDDIPDSYGSINKENPEKAVRITKKIVNGKLYYRGYVLVPHFMFDPSKDVIITKS